MGFQRLATRDARPPHLGGLLAAGAAGGGARPRRPPAEHAAGARQRAAPAKRRRSDRSSTASCRRRSAGWAATTASWRPASRSAPPAPTAGCAAANTPSPTRPTTPTSLKVWLPQAEAGDAEAMYYVGQIYEKGLRHRARLRKRGGLVPPGRGQGLRPRRGESSARSTSRVWASPKTTSRRSTGTGKAAGLAQDLVVLEAGEYEALQKAKAELEPKSGELDKLKKEIDELHRQIGGLEKPRPKAGSGRPPCESLVGRLEGELASRQQELAAGRSRLAELERRQAAGQPARPAAVLAATAGGSGRAAKASLEGDPLRPVPRPGDRQRRLQPAAGARRRRRRSARGGRPAREKIRLQGAPAGQRHPGRHSRGAQRLPREADPEGQLPGLLRRPRPARRRRRHRLLAAGRRRSGPADPLDHQRGAHRAPRPDRRQPRLRGGQLGVRRPAHPFLGGPPAARHDRRAALLPHQAADGQGPAWCSPRAPAAGGRRSGGGGRFRRRLPRRLAAERRGARSFGALPEGQRPALPGAPGQLEHGVRGDEMGPERPRRSSSSCRRP